MPLPSLPEEILDLIVENAANEIALLQSLRQVCKHFSRLHSVLSNLFWAIRLIADRDYLIREGELRASGIAPHVRHITFVQPLRTWTSFDEFVDIFEYAFYDRRGPFDRLVYQSESEEEESDLESPTPEEWIRDPHQRLKVGPHRKMDFRIGHMVYNRKFGEAADLMSNLIEAWVPLLKLCNRCSSFSFPAVDYHWIDLEFNPMLRESVRAGVWKDDLVCPVNLSANVADDFVPKVVACLTAARLVTCDLDISHAYVPSEMTTYSDHWSNFNFQGLKWLKFAPYLPHSVGEGDEDNILLHLEIILQNMLSCCASSLEVLLCKPYPCARYTYSPVPMPYLQELWFNSSEMSSLYFAEWMAALPSLTALYLDGNLEVPEPKSGAKTIYDALRNHKTLRNGELYLVMADYQGLVAFQKDDVLQNEYADP